MEQFHGTTIVSARRGNRVALGGDGQVTLGNVVVKASARKVRLAGLPCRYTTSLSRAKIVGITTGLPSA